LADRYTYIPLIGLFIIAAWAVPDMLKKWPHRREVLVALSALCLLLPVAYYVEAGRILANSLTLNTRALEVTNRNSILYNNRGIIYTERADYSRALEDFNKAIEINPRYAEAYSNGGVAYNSLGSYTHRQAAPALLADCRQKRAFA